MKIDKMKLYGGLMIACIVCALALGTIVQFADLTPFAKWGIQMLVFWSFMGICAWCEHVYDKEFDRREKGE